METTKYFSQWLFLALTFIFLMILRPGKANNTPAEPFRPEDSIKSSRGLFLELNAETFLKQGVSSGRNYMGLAAIMLEVEGSLHRKFSFSGALGFDSSLWQDFLNTPAALRYQPTSQTELTPAVEEFLISWIADPDHFSVSAGRMLSGINYAGNHRSADSYFNYNPRIFTEYWGDNGGLALDGIRGQWQQQTDEFTGSLTVEAAKNGYHSEQFILTTIIDLNLQAESLEIGTRWFGYFDHQEHEHPFLKWNTTDHSGTFVCEGFGFNAWGAAINASWRKEASEKAILQLQLMNRKLGDSFVRGGYASLVYNLTPRLSNTLMLQHLERPVFQEASLKVKEERGITLGMAYMPLPGHRLCLEYNYFANSSFYADMIVAKWSFLVTL
ncbi:MAG: hypothetical protein R6U64_05555 [Bacteroidales bacterium]